jgi:hypothetical protein
MIRIDMREGQMSEKVVSKRALKVEPAVKALRIVLVTLLLGFGFLVIARVLEAGVALKQDQDLTV